MASAGTTIVSDELAVLAKVERLLAEEPYVAPPKEDDLVKELVRLREEIPGAKAEDQGALMDQYHQNVSLLEQIRAARQAPQVDPSCPYFAHLRLSEAGKERDVCLGKATRIQHGVRIIDWRNAPISRLFYRYQQGDDYEEELGGKMVIGEIVARRTVAIANGVLDRVEAPEGVFRRVGDDWTHAERETVRLAGGEGAALRAHGHGEGTHRRLGTDLEGSRRRLDKRLPDVAGLLDPAQFALITKPSTGLVVIRGSAGSGKTTVALHRIAWLAYDDPAVDSERAMFVVFSPALRDYVSHVLPALGVNRVRVITFRAWAEEQRKRHFPMLPKAVRDSTPALVTRLKVHPAVLVALEEQVKRHAAPSTPESAIDDWASVLTNPDTLRPILDEIAPERFSEAELLRATTWLRDRHTELTAWLEGERGEHPPELDVEDDALLLRAWQLRVGPLKSRGGATLRLRHLAIDEVQDLSPLEVRVLLGCLDERQSVTLAGDTQQHVMQDSGFTSWDEFFAYLGIPGTMVDTLKISYRCTAEVMAFSLSILGELREDETPPQVTRSGPAVELFTFTDHGACVAFLADVLDQLMHEEPLASVAMLTPGADVSQMYFHGLQKSDIPRLRLVESQDFTFAPGIEITEIDQVKGLEFDYVILIDATAARFPDMPGARRLLHVGATRAVHQLWVTSVGTPSAIIREAMGQP
jgi:DNA helicase-2/ATP-dependent DNA helicase PcrA